MASDIQDKMSLISRVICLMLDSDVYLPDTLYNIKKQLIGPIFQDQALIMVRDGKVVAYCSWAFLTEEAEKRYIADSNSLQVTDWKGGDRVWLVDVIAPFNDGTRLLNATRKLGQKLGHTGKKIKFKSYKTARSFDIREVRL